MSDLSQLPVVIIDEVEGYKFIVAIVSMGEISKMVIRANQHCEFHRDILKNLGFKIPGLIARCIGGGRINVDPVNKIIKIWGSSGDFGVEPNRAETARLLQEAFSDFNISSENS